MNMLLGDKIKKILMIVHNGKWHDVTRQEQHFTDRLQWFIGDEPFIRLKF